MHELSLARAIVAAVRHHLSAEDGPVRGVRVSIGSARGIVPESLTLAFEACVVGTPLAGALLIIEQVPSRARCGGCGTPFEFDGMIGTCPACGHVGGELITGDGLELRAIEMADA